MAPDYTSFQTEDFVLDDSFQAFATGADAAAVAFWQDWLAAHPAQRPAAEQAQQLVRLLSQARQPAVAAQQMEQDVQRLQRSLRQPAAPRLRVQRRWRQRLIMSLLLVLGGLGIGYWLWPPYGLSPVRYATEVGQQRRVRLPDGSTVVLNGNSRLTTAATWAADAPREVWLEGEGYFEVSHLSRVPGLPVAQGLGNEKFVVHAGELNVAVLGTTFNVINRPERRHSVTLNSGKVLVEHPTLLGREALLMAPGELVEYTLAQHTLVKRRVEPARYSAWVNGALDFDHTPLPEVIRMLRDTYGLEIILGDPALLSRTITGTLPGQNAEVLVQALAKSLGVRPERAGNQVHFRSLN